MSQAASKLNPLSKLVLTRSTSDCFNDKPQMMFYGHTICQFNKAWQMYSSILRCNSRKQAQCCHEMQIGVFGWHPKAHAYSVAQTHVICVIRNILMCILHATSLRLGYLHYQHMHICLIGLHTWCSCSCAQPFERFVPFFLLAGFLMRLFGRSSSTNCKTACMQTQTATFLNIHVLLFSSKPRVNHTSHR